MCAVQWVGPGVRIRMRRRFIFCLVRALQMAATVKGASKDGAERRREGGREEDVREEERGPLAKNVRIRSLLFCLKEFQAEREREREGGREGGEREAAFSTAAAQSHCIASLLPVPPVAGAGGGVKRRFYPDLGHGAPFCITTAQCHTKSQSQVLLLDAPRRRDTRPSRGRRGAEYVSSRVRQMKAFYCLNVLRRCISAVHRDPRPDRLSCPSIPYKG